MSWGACLVMGYCVLCGCTSSTPKSCGITAHRALGQPWEERIQRVCCYGCCASQERINASAVPMVAWVFSQLPCLHLVYSGFNKQCTQWDTVRQLVSQTGSAIQSSTCRWLWLLTGDLDAIPLFPHPWFLCTSWKDLWASLWVCQGPCTLTVPSWSPWNLGVDTLAYSPHGVEGPEKRAARTLESGLRGFIQGFCSSEHPEHGWEQAHGHFSRVVLGALT